MPSVRVIVPVRNEERQLGRSLTALLANRFDDFDVVVVDDASTDGTAAVARSFARGGRVRVMRNRARRGLSAGVNRASAETDAALPFFVGGDCTPHPEWIAEGVRAFADPTVCAVEGAIHYANPSPGFRHRVPVDPFYNLSRRGSLTVPGTDYANGNFAVRREVFAAVGGFNAERYARGGARRTAPSRGRDGGAAPRRAADPRARTAPAASAPAPRARRRAAAARPPGGRRAPVARRASARRAGNQSGAKPRASVWARVLRNTVRAPCARAARHCAAVPALSNSTTSGRQAASAPRTPASSLVGDVSSQVTPAPAGTRARAAAGRWRLSTKWQRRSGQRRRAAATTVSWRANSRLTK